MSTGNFVEAALFEHRFWLQVMGDHGRFILETVSPKEMEIAKRAQYFVFVFDHLLAQSRQPLSAGELSTVTQQANYYTAEIRQFKLDLLAMHLRSEIAIGLTPTFFNHMVNEAEEYLRVLGFLLAGEVPPPCHPLHYHLLWLPDSVGHAAGIADNLDPVEKKLKKKLMEYMKQFEVFFIKATEMAGYLRTNISQFPALSRFNTDVELEMKLFTSFLKEIEELELDEKVLARLNALMPDHMAREQCYYLIKLSEVSIVEPLEGCDPTKPRTME
ncbi:DUF2935 domain-containing protein [Brevibacillus dissolubilis]|uniref:DUF2935 domain-containing protein n=1 Tax=Brevibacillus dissolubilis TaxID=1844116 RepID=UPI0011178A61|nr:DUF2935 domain-containing protein [Brevibacillus dissolubilis]